MLTVSHPLRIGPQGSRAGLGCTALFALPFLAAGGWVIVIGVRALMRHAPTTEWLVPMGVGLAFVAVPVTMVAAAASMQRRAAAAAALREQHPDAPWLWRREWAEGVLLDQLAPGALFLFLFALVWNGISIPLLVVVFRNAQRHDPKILFALLFPAIGVGLIAAAGYQILRRQKYGVSRCRLDRVPVTPGSEFRGEIETRIEETAGHGVVLRLTSIRRTTTGSGKNRSTTEAILWRDEQTVGSAWLARSPVGTRVPFRFTLPADAQPTDERNPSDVFLWRLDVSADVEGIDFAARFELPVFNEGSSPNAVRQFAGDDSAAASRSPQPDSRITITQEPGGGEQIVVGTRARPADFVGLVLFATVWFGVTALMFKLHAPLFFPLIFALFGISIVLALLDNWVGRSIIRISSSNLSARREWFRGLGLTRTVPLGTLESIASSVAMTSGGGSGTPYYSVDAVLKGGKRMRIAMGIRDRRDAEMIAARLRTSLSS